MIKFIREAIANVAWAFEKGLVKVAPFIAAVVALVALAILVMVVGVGITALAKGWDFSW